MKKILLFTDSLGAGGAQRQLVGLAYLLKDKGYHVKVCTYHHSDFYKSYLDENHIKNEIIPNALDTRNRIWAVHQYFKREKPNWVIAYQETPSLVACFSRLMGCKFKLIVSERNTTQKIGWNERIRFFLYRFADTIVPNSFAQEKWLATHYPWMKKKIKTITNFVDLEKFYYIEHIRKDIPVIMVAASVWHPKNTLGLITATSILKDRGVKLKIMWYGKTKKWVEYLSDCYKLIEQYELDEYFSLLDKTKDIKSIYHESDYFCLPSFYEGTPNVICEAIASGLPVMCSDVCDNSRYVVDGNNGILFNPQNPYDMADKIQTFISQSDDDYMKACKESRNHAEKLLSKEIFIEKYLQILK